MFIITINGNPHSLTLPNIPKKPFHIFALLDSSTAVPVMCVNVECQKKTFYKECLQCFGASLQRCPALITNLVIFLNEPNADEQDIPASEPHILVLRNCLKVRDGNGVGGPRVIRQRTPILGVITDEIKEDTAATDTVRSPIYCKRQK
jgi:hypothetical protein